MLVGVSVGVRDGVREEVADFVGIVGGVLVCAGVKTDVCVVATVVTDTLDGIGECIDVGV